MFASTSIRRHGINEEQEQEQEAQKGEEQKDM
jgi:hypothetical protein